MCDPMYPAPPVTQTFIAPDRYHESRLCRTGALRSAARRGITGE